jgi:cytochrome bd-type quinol oxidase subunit 2
MKNKSTFVTDLLLFSASVFFSIGTKFIFHACDKKDDGTYMACHWAEQAVFAVSIAIVVISVTVIFVKNRHLKAGAAASVIPCALMAAVIPNNMINLCMMNTMRCHSTMRPFIIISAVIIIILAIADIILNIRKKEDKNET